MSSIGVGLVSGNARRGGEILRGEPRKKAERSSWIDIDMKRGGDYCQLGWFRFWSPPLGQLFPMGYLRFFILNFTFFTIYSKNNYAHFFENNTQPAFFTKLC
jgi:hypothetical protein